MIKFASLLLIAIGLYGILSTRNVIKMLVGINIMEIGINIFIIAVGFVNGGEAPILSIDTISSTLRYVDPIAQALVLTSIVIGLGITAVGLVFARSLHKKYGTYELPESGGES